MEYVREEDKWKTQAVARLAANNCTKYLIEFIRNRSVMSKIAKTLARFSRNDDEIVWTVMEELEKIKSLEDEFEVGLEFQLVMRSVLDLLYQLERWHTAELLVVELQKAGYKHGNY